MLNCLFRRITEKFDLLKKQTAIHICQGLILAPAITLFSTAHLFKITTVRWNLCSRWSSKYEHLPVFLWVDLPGDLKWHISCNGVIIQSDSLQFLQHISSVIVNTTSKAAGSYLLKLVWFLVLFNFCTVCNLIWGLMCSIVCWCYFLCASPACGNLQDISQVAYWRDWHDWSDVT